MQAEALRSKIEQLEREQQEMAMEISALDESLGTAASPGKDPDSSVDSRSVYVGNVDYDSQPDELAMAFSECGTVNRVTILCDVMGNPKGYAYIEFEEPSAVARAIDMKEGAFFRNRQLKVCEKRRNVPGMSAPRGARRSRGGGESGYRPRRYSPYSAGPRRRAPGSY
eukprot:TRINITY_DN16456_c0_g1_i1.p2 TRINITY_DN16456_c0_g1~~TRINITY_DN16456_c0_g1_i1.p2  ORF type:complete len:168 (-),score=37.62 TRINITY_DN16456_c0_g1_i1:42-545(-)